MTEKNEADFVEEEMDVEMHQDVSSLLNILGTTTNKDEAYKMIVDLQILAETKASKVKEELSHVDLGPFLKKQLNSNLFEGKPKDASIRLTDKIFNLVGVTRVLSTYNSIVTEALRKGDEQIKLLYLKQLASASLTLEGASFLVKNMHNDCQQSSLLVDVIENIADNSLSIANEASMTIKNIMLFSEVVAENLSNSLMQSFNMLLCKGSIVRFRVYQLFVDIVTKNNDIIENNDVQTVVKCLIEEFDSNDVLSQLNSLEMLSNLASLSSKTLHLIAESGLLEKVITVFKNMEANPMQQIILPGCVKFFGSIATTMPQEVLTKYPDFVEYIFLNLNADDPMIVVLCIETISLICSSDHGIQILHQNPEKMNQAMNIVGKIIQSSLDEFLKIKVLDSLSILFSANHDCSDQISLIKAIVFQHIGKNPTEILMNCAKQPFPKIRHSSLGVLKTIAQYTWIEQDIALTPGFLEYLLDRKTEGDTEGKKLKYSILKTLSQSFTSKQNLGLDYHQRICKYVQEGPFHSEQETSIQFDKS